MPINRIIIMRQPQGGLAGVHPEIVCFSGGPVYEPCDSGRDSWKGIDHDAKGFLWACTKSGHAVVDPRQTAEIVGKSSMRQGTIFSWMLNV